MTPLSRFVPRTLLARTFLLVSLLIFVSGATWFTLFGLAEREPRAQQLAQLSVSVVNLTRAALVAADPINRLMLLQDLAEREGVHIYPAEESDVVVPLPDNFFFAIMRQATQSQLGDKTRFASAVNGQEGIWLSFVIDGGDKNAEDDEYWLMLPGEHARETVPWQWLGWGVASLIVALLVAWLIVARVTLPLRALAASAREVGHGHHPEPLAEVGAAELRQLAEAFNRMSDDLRQSAAERAEVLAGISHDLRTPLTRLRLESEISVADPEAREAMVGDIEQMDSIIAQFLDYARGEGDEAAQLGDVNALLAQVVAGRGRQAPPALHLADLPPTPIRPKALARALANLLDNARKYGQEPFAVHTRVEENEILIEVMDSGPGVPEDEIERMKRPFTRLESARTDASGTGLGLAIVERIARLHGGRLELANRPEGGLTARLRLPTKTG